MKNEEDFNPDQAVSLLVLLSAFWAFDLCAAVSDGVRWLAETFWRGVLWMTLQDETPEEIERRIEEEDYARFVASVAHECTCRHPFLDVCDSVLAGGPCDQFDHSREYTFPDEDEF